MGCTDSTICLVASLLQYIAGRGDKPGPFFLVKSGATATKPLLVSHTRKALRAPLGLPQGDFAGHSFRTWAATTAALRGVKDSTIKTLGRWNSSAFLQYIRTLKERLAALSAVIVWGHWGPWSYWRGARLKRPSHSSNGPWPNHSQIKYRYC